MRTHDHTGFEFARAMHMTVVVPTRRTDPLRIDDPMYGVAVSQISRQSAECTVHLYSPSPRDTLTGHYFEGGGVVVALAGYVLNLDELADGWARTTGSGTVRDPAEALALGLKVLGLNAMVAALRGKFALFVHTEGRHHFIRDHIGEEQLYYSSSGAHSVVSTTIRPIVKALALALPSRMSDSMVTFETPVFDETMFGDVHKVQSGHVVTLDRDRRWSAACYWAPTSTSAFTGTVDDAADELTRLLCAAVAKRVPDDVPSAYLSGGQDSSWVVGELTRSGCGVAKAYTTAFPGLPVAYDESRWAALVARDHATTHRVLEPGLDDFVSNFPLVMQIADEVKANAAHFTEFWVAQAAHADGATHLFSGYGADESLGGEVRYLALLLDCPREEGIRERVNDSVLLAPYLPLFEKLWQLPAGTPMADKYFHLVRRGLSPRDEEFRTIVQKIFAEASNGLDGACLTDVHLTSPPLLDSQRLNKYWGVEKLCPFLDLDVVEFAFSLPATHKVEGLRTKEVLRRASAGRVPRAVTERSDKVGFAFPHNSTGPREFLARLASDYAERSGSPVLADATRGAYDRTALMAASFELVVQSYESSFQLA